MKQCFFPLRSSKVQRTCTWRGKGVWMYNHTSSCFWGYSLSTSENMTRVCFKEKLVWINCGAKAAQRASSDISLCSECVSASGWSSKCSWWWALLCSDSWSCWWCESGCWSACRTSSSFSRMSFSVSSPTPGGAGMGKSVPLSLVSLLQRRTYYGEGKVQNDTIFDTDVTILYHKG